VVRDLGTFLLWHKVSVIRQTIQLPLPIRKPAISLVSESRSLWKGIKMKIVLWIVGIIFLIGLLVVTGVLKLIF
jgi:hypothetical protein